MSGERDSSASASGLTGALHQLSRILQGNQPLDRVLGTISEQARALIPGAWEVSMTLVVGGDPFTAAYTGAVALELDERQYEAGHGPCLDAARTGTEMRIHDMAAETRWPHFTARGVQAGAGSSLSVPLPVQERVIGALNIYGAAAKAFDEADAALARTFAWYAAIALRNAQAIAALAAQAPEAHASRAIGEQAKSIIVGDRRRVPDEAPRIPRSVSRTSNRNPRDVAQARLLDFDTAAAAIIIGLAGEYDLANKQAILDQVASVLALRGVQEVALDMSQVTFIDCTALGAMIAAHRICGARGKRLTVRNPSRPVARMLLLTSTGTLFA